MCYPLAVFSFYFANHMIPIRYFIFWNETLWLIAHFLPHIIAPAVP